MKVLIVLLVASAVSAQIIARKTLARAVAAPGVAVGGYGYGYGLAAPAGLAVHRGVAVGAPAIGVAGLDLGLAAPAGIAVHRGVAVGAPAVGVAGLGLGLAAPAVSIAAPAVAGFGLGLGLRHGAVGVNQHIGPVAAAIHTYRTAQVVDVPTNEDVITPTNLIVEPNVLPVNIEFRSQSSPVNVGQVHIPGRPGEVQHTNSEDEPDRLVHEVVKPVIQEIRETIVPFRSITQEVLPVQEEVHSLVARGQRQQVLAAQPVVAAQRVAVAAPAVAGLAVHRGVAVGAPAVGVAGLGLGLARPAGLAVGGLGIGGLAVARPAGLAVAGPVATGVVAGPALATGGLISTGIARFGGVIGGDVLPIKA